MFRSNRLALLLAALLTTFLAACESMNLPRARLSTRAIWVTRFDYKTKDDIVRIADACKQSGATDVLFQVRGNATAFYRSSYEPWAEQFEFADPGFDPLATMIEEGHARGLDVHAWVNVIPAWWGSAAPKSPEQVVNKHPEWLWYDKDGKRQPFADKFYVSLNPCLPEVRRYLVDVMRDLVARYSIDGLHLDYIRFPNDLAKGVDYPRDARTLSLFEGATGATPETDPAAWDRWRADQITILVRDLRYMIDRNKPHVELSAAVGAVPEKALAHHQDVKTWMSERLVDTVYPMNYARDLKTFGERLALWRDLSKGTPVVMGVMLEPDDNGKIDVEVVEEQLHRSLASFNGYSLFAYSSLYDSPNDATAKQDESARFRRDQFRKAMTPVLQEMRDPGAGQDR